jgi:hypothetical protein
MTRSTAGSNLARAAVAAGLLAMLVSCAPPRAGLAPPPAVEEISIQVSGCATDNIAIVVHPWTAYVERGRPLRWTTPATVDSVVIQATRPGQWPFEWAQPGQPQRRAARGGAAIQAGAMRPGAAAGSYSYRFLLYCDGRVIDIDPDIVIFDPM